MAHREKGVEKQLIRAGNGPKPIIGQLVTVDCTAFGKNNDLTQAFWSTNDDMHKPFTFVIGEGNVIKGWDEGVSGMQRGEVARLKCPPDYAFGAEGFPAWGIQPNSVLEFEIELLYIDVQSGADASSGQMGRAKRKSASREKSRIDYPEQREKERKENELYSHLIASGLPLYTACNVLGAKGRSFRYSKMALQFFHENQNEEFELVRPVHSQNLELFPPGCDRFQNCCHVSFTARPKNASSNAGQKYFFAELLKERMIATLVSNLVLYWSGAIVVESTTVV